MESSTLTVASILETLGTVATSVIGVFGDVMEFIVSNPLTFCGILIPAAIALIYGGYRLAKRALKRR